MTAHSEIIAASNAAPAVYMPNANNTFINCRSPNPLCSPNKTTLRITAAIDA